MVRIAQLFAMYSFLWEVGGAADFSSSSSGQLEPGDSRLIVLICKWILVWLTGIAWRILGSVVHSDDIRLLFYSGLRKESPESPEMPSGIPRSISDSFPSSEDGGKAGKRSFYSVPAAALQVRELSS